MNPILQRKSLLTTTLLALLLSFAITNAYATVTDTFSLTSEDLNNAYTATNQAGITMQNITNCGDYNFTSWILNVDLSDMVWSNTTAYTFIITGETTNADNNGSLSLNLIGNTGVSLSLCNGTTWHNLSGGTVSLDGATLITLTITDTTFDLALDTVSSVNDTLHDNNANTHIIPLTYFGYGVNNNTSVYTSGTMSIVYTVDYDALTGPITQWLPAIISFAMLAMVLSMLDSFQSKR